MVTESPKGLEYRHIKCGENMVNAVLREHAMFRWELVATQTIISKESHLEPGGFLDAVFGDKDVIYSVWSEERFATVDIKRDKSIPNLEQIKKLENEYFQIVARLQDIGCSPVDNYATPSGKESLGCGSIFFPLGLTNKQAIKAIREGGIKVLFCPWLAPLQRINRQYEEKLAVHRQLKTELDKLIMANKQILNI